MIKEAEDSYKTRVQNDIMENPKAFWNYVNSKRRNMTSKVILKEGEALAVERCADEFAKYFHSVYSREPPMLDTRIAIAQAGAENGAARVHVGTLQLKDVQRALQQLKPKKSAGPDGIPPYIFRDCRAVLDEPLLYIFNLSLEKAEFPVRWKTTRVIPVPKGSAGASVDGYRPVAVLSTPAKVFESAIHKIVYTQVNSQLSEAQHGFRPLKSTTSNLLNYVSDILPEVDAGGQIDAAYFDFKKAFDLVNNDVLLKKLAGFGFTPHLLNFFASYMKDRQQYVEFAGSTSDAYFTRSGVSQGSNLGPLQFLLMINNLPEVVQDAKCLLFADDLKLYLPIRAEEDGEKLQRDIDRVVAWSRENLLQFNTSKCVTISFTRARNYTRNSYKVDDTPMVRVEEVRDLGVRLNTELHFRDHIASICRKAYRNLGFVLRRVQRFSIAAIVTLYNALVRSQLEWNAIIWAPYEAKYKLMLERVQNKFTRYLYLRLYGVYPFYPLMYPTLFVLGMVGYNDLKVRRDVALVTYVFKIMIGKVHNADLLSRVGMCVPNRYVWRRRRPRLLAVPAARTRLLAEAPLTRALRILNVIADDVDLFCCNLSEFTKAALMTVSYKI